MQRSHSRFIWFGLGAIILASGGYGLFRLLTPGVEPAAVQPSGLDFEPNADQRRKLDALRAQLNESNRRFASEDARQKSNAKLFTYMAGTSDEPLVVEAALAAIQQAYSSRSSRKEAPDADLDRVLLKHLRSRQGSLASAAFEASRIPLMSERPGAELVSGLMDLARNAEAPRRYAALAALDLLRPNSRSREVLETFEAALSDPEAHIVSVALFALAQSGASFEADRASMSASLGSRVLALTEHADPGVRGRALAALAELAWLAESTPKAERAAKLLGDALPYVRAQAADALARFGATWAIHRLIELVDDVSPANYDLVGWTALDGKPGRLPHALAGRRRVAEAAIYAIQSLSASVQGVGGPLELTLGGRGRSEQQLSENAERAKAWYRAARQHVPPAP